MDPQLPIDAQTQHRQNSLPFAMFGRVVGAVAEVMRYAPQYKDNNSSWHFVARSDPWYPELASDRVLKYTRTHRPGAVVKLENLQLSPIAEVDWEEPVTVSDSNTEQYSIQARVPAGQSFKTRFQHTFSETTSLEEAVNVSATLAFEAQVGYTPSTATGGATGGVKFTASATAGYNKRWNTSSTNSRTVDIEIPVMGPFFGHIRAKRSTQKQSVTGFVTPIFEGQPVVYENGQVIYRWNSLGELYSVLSGDAPTDRALSQEWSYRPASEVILRSFRNRRLPKVHFTTVYDNVSAIDIEFIPNKELMGGVEPAEQLDPNQLLDQ